MAVTGLAIDHIKKRMATRQDAAAALATELYKGGTSAGLESVLASRSIDAVETKLEYLRTSQQAQTKVFETLAVDQRLLAHKLAVLDQEKQQAQQTEARLADLKRTLDAKVASQRDEVATLTREAMDGSLHSRRKRAAAVATVACETPRR